MESPSFLAILFLFLLTIYLYLLHQRLQRTPGRLPHEPYPTPLPSREEILEKGQGTDDITAERMLKDFPQIAQPTKQCYLVVGGSGFVGSAICRLLLARGETNIRVADLAPLPSDLQAAGINYVQVDLENEESIKKAVSIPFEGKNGKTAEVVYHTAAAIRFVERSTITYKYSYVPNVLGTKRLLSSLQALPTPPHTFIMTSSGNIFLPEAKFLRLYRTAPIVFSDKSPIRGSSFHYVNTKSLADKTVRDADGKGGIRTTVLRPGMAIVGSGDIFLSYYLRQPSNPTFGDDYTQSFIHCKDLAAAELLAESCMRPKELGGLGLENDMGGKGFLVTGDNTQWYTQGSLRSILQTIAARDLKFVPLPMLPSFLIAHLLETFLTLRLYFLTYVVRVKGRVAPTPRWMGPAALFQPGLWEMSRDVWLDDTPFRKLSGYYNHYSSIQTLTSIANGHSSKDPDRKIIS